MIFLFLLTYAIVAFYEIPVLKRKGSLMDLITFILFMAIALALSLLYSLHIEIPSPVIAIKAILDSLHLHY